MRCRLREIETERKFSRELAVQAIERPVRDLTRQALEEIERINRASVGRQYSAIVQRSSRHYTRLLAEVQK